MKRVMSCLGCGLILAALAAGVWSCTARSTSVVTQPVSPAALSEFKLVALSVESGVAEDVKKEMTDLASATLARITESTRFKEARFAEASESSAGTLLVKVKITALKRVGETTRFLAGAFAGRANMKADVTLIDAATGKTVGAHKVVGESGGTGYSGGTDDAVRKTADAIAKLLG